MPKRFSATEKWDDPWFRKLPNEYKCFWDYICLKCDLIGVWKTDIEMVNFCLAPGIITEERALSLFNYGKKRIRVLSGGSSWLITDFVSFQYGTINPNNNLHRSVMSRLESLGAQQGLSRGSAAPLVKVKEAVKVVVKKSFTIPTIKEIKEYCSERKNFVDPERFFNFYESKGWMVGKNKMKDWKAAVRNWEKENTEHKAVEGAKRAGVDTEQPRMTARETPRNVVRETDEYLKKLREGQPGGV